VFVSDRNLAQGNVDGNGKIFLFDTSTRTFTQITNSTGGGSFAATFPSINANGTHITFSSDRDLTRENPDGNSEIFLFDISTGTLRQLTNTTGVRIFGEVPAINADGTRITFSSTGDLTGNNTDLGREIFLFDTPASRFTQITNTTKGNPIAPSINANGTRVTFDADSDLTGNNADLNREIFLFDTSTSRLTQITNSTGGDNLIPSINSDGTRIAFESTANLVGGNTDGNSEIFLLDTAAGTLRQVTNSAGDGIFANSSASISLDGTRIAFDSTRDLTQANADGNLEIFLFDPSTGRFTQLTNSTRVTGSNLPSIHSDGTRIAFESNANLTGQNADGNTEIFLASCASITGANIQIPTRWCGVQGSPSMTSPRVVGENSTNNVLLRRLMRVNDNIYMPQAAIGLRSGATAKIPDFPIIPDPNTQIGTPGDVSFGSGFDYSELTRLVCSCKAVWQTRDPTVTGLTALHINQFVVVGSDGVARPDSTLGIARLSLLSNGATQLTGGAAMIDNAYTLPTSTLRVRQRDRFDKTLGHELGHRLTLEHGNGVDDDIDEPGEGGPGDTFPYVGPNLMQYQAEGITITPAQSTRMRSQALRHIPDRAVDSVPPPLANGKVDPNCNNLRAAEAFIDIVDFGVAQDQEVKTITFFTSTAGLLPEDVLDVNYFFFADLDNNPSTGGSPADIGFSTTVQGVEFIGQVEVDVIHGFPQAIPTVLLFQAGQFVGVTDPSIQAAVLTESVELLQELDQPLGASEVPISQNIQLKFRDDLLAPMSTNIVLGTLTQNPITGTMDNAEAALTFEPPSFPSCQVNPEVVTPGNEVTVAARNLPPNVPAEIFLGSDPVATDQIDNSGNITVRFVIPADAATGDRGITIVAENTSITADCSLVIAGIDDFEEDDDVD
jgi:Tol biopolymer transport system component